MTVAGRSADSFRNEPILELRRAPARESLLQALRELDERLPLEVPVLIGGDRGATEGIDSTDPGAPERVVATSGPGRGRGGAPPRWRPPCGARPAGAAAPPPSGPRS